MSSFSHITAPLSRVSIAWSVVSNTLAPLAAGVFVFKRRRSPCRKWAY